MDFLSSTYGHTREDDLPQAHRICLGRNTVRGAGSQVPGCTASKRATAIKEKGRISATLLVELLGVEPASPPGSMPSELQARSVSVRFSTGRYLTPKEGLGLRREWPDWRSADGRVVMLRLCPRRGAASQQPASPEGAARHRPAPYTATRPAGRAAPGHEGDDTHPARPKFPCFVDGLGR